MKTIKFSQETNWRVSLEVNIFSWRIIIRMLSALTLHVIPVLVLIKFILLRTLIRQYLTNSSLVSSALCYRFSDNLSWLHVHRKGLVPDFICRQRTCGRQKFQYLIFAWHLWRSFIYFHYKTVSPLLPSLNLTVHYYKHVSIHKQMSPSQDRTVILVS